MKTLMTSDWMDENIYIIHRFIYINLKIVNLYNFKIYLIFF